MKTRKLIKKSKLVKFDNFKLPTKKTNKVIGKGGQTTADYVP